jgi:hypothetical protein
MVDQQINIFAMQHHLCVLVRPCALLVLFEAVVPTRISTVVLLLSAVTEGAVVVTVDSVGMTKAVLLLLSVLLVGFGTTTTDGGVETTLGDGTDVISIVSLLTSVKTLALVGVVGTTSTGGVGWGENVIMDGDVGSNVAFVGVDMEGVVLDDNNIHSCNVTTLLARYS